MTPTSPPPKRNVVRRGELRTYVRPSTPDTLRTVVIVSNDAINESGRPWCLGIQLVEQDPADVLSIPVEDGRFAHPSELTRLYRAWIGARVGRLDSLTLGRVDSVLRGALDL